ncbi:MAG TPA: HEAT repeat domain-containing protein, partial [Pirellulales bacterium]|nr:HEAT repeat domain-containing protein [Pirellulales bacterium]
MLGRTWFTVASVLACCAVLAAEESKEGKDFKLARRGIQQQMKSRNPETRLAAVRRLADYPTAEAAKVLFQMGFASGDELVRKAAYETLLVFKDNPEVCDYLVAEVKKETKRGNADPSACAALAVLLASELKIVVHESQELLDQVGGSKGGVSLLVTLADELATIGDDVSVAILLKLSKSASFDDEFGLRRAVVQALARSDQLGAVDALIGLLEKIEGEVRADAVQYLAGISGERFGSNAKAWRAWWEENREGFRFPPAVQRAVARAELGAGQTSYYSLPLYAKRLVFVLDTSTSMRGPRIYAAKRELVRAIEALPQEVRFSVLAFNGRTFVWKKDLMEATGDNKKKATAFVNSQELGGRTASYDALEAALKFDAEAIYFLTDGAPAG